MAIKKSFSKNKKDDGGGNVAIAPKPEEKNLPVVQTGAPAGVSGEITPDDIRIPRINIVNPMSKLHTEAEFDIGDIVMDKEISLINKEEALIFVVLDVVKKYQQKIPYDSEESPTVCDTEAEIKEFGGTTNWSKEAVDDLRYFEQLAHLVLAVKAPDGLDESELHRFPHEGADGHWTRVAMTVNGGSFRSFAKNIITQAFSKLRDGLQYGLWALEPEKKTSEKGTWFVPNSKFTGMVDDEHKAFFDELAARDIPEEEEG